MTRVMMWSGLALVLSGLAACGNSDPSAGLVPADETLSVRIHEDGSKFFVYRRESSPQALAEASRQRGFNADIGPRLEQVVTLSGYCRDGFFELYSEREPGVLMVHGECREDATMEDRARYQADQVIFFQAAR